MLDFFANPEVWGALVTLTFLEVILGIDNVIFISIVTGKLPEEQRKRTARLGLLLAMFMRIALLFAISWLIAMQKPWFEINWKFVQASVNGQSLILFVGGLFLIYKSTKEIHEKVAHQEIEGQGATSGKAVTSIGNAILQIIIIDIIFSVDSILTAVGMTNGLEGALYIMIIAVIISVLIMMMFAVPLGTFVHKNPSIQILALSFLILIGFMLITEGAHKAQAVIFDQHVEAVPKGYLYFAITFSLLVEFLNMRIRKKSARN